MRSTQQIQNFPVHAYTARRIHNKGVSRPEGFPDWQFIYTHSGSGVLDGTELIGSGDVMLIRPEAPHSYEQSGDEPWMITYITFGGRAVRDGLFELLGLTRPLTIFRSNSFPDRELTERLFDLARSEYGEHSYADDLIMNATLYQIILQCRLCAFPENEKIPPSLEISGAVQYMTEHLGENISTEQLTHATGTSIYALYKVFKQTLKCTPWEYLTLLRLEKAKSLLCSNPEMSVKEIGLAVGLGGAGIHRHFKASFGLTPGEYREKNNQPAEPERDALPIYICDAHEVIDQAEERWQDARRENCWQLVFFDRGTGSLINEADGEALSVHPGDICLLSPEADCRFVPLERPWTVLRVGFGGKYVRRMLRTLGFEEINLIRGSFSFMMRHNFSSDLGYDFPGAFDKICLCAWDTSFSAALRASVLLYELLMYMSILSEETSSVTDDMEAIAPAVEYIRTNYMYKITTGELAMASGLSEGTLARLFKNVYKKTPHEFIFGERLDRAKRLLLRRSSMSVTDIALHTGFSSASHFIAAFKSRENITPDEYRELYLS